MLQERINKISQYFRSMEMTNGIIIIKVQYNNKWGVYPSDDNKIKVAKSEDTPNEWFYYGNFNDITVDDIFDLIENTIEMNLSAAAKLELLNSKFEELKNLFATESLERLSTLKFVLSNKKSYRKNKKTVNTDEPSNTENIDKKENNNE